MVASNERTEPTLTFESIEEVLSLTRRVAEEDYRRHLQAVIGAQGDEARTAAIAALAKSAEAAALADSALKSAITSNTDFRSSTVDAVKGNEASAASGFKRSGMSMEKGAESLERYAGYVPESKFFAAAMSTVQRLDHYVAGAEVSAQQKVSAFARGLKAFAKGMTDFGKEVAATPGRVKEAVKEKAASAAVSVVVAGVIAEMAVRHQVRQVGAAFDGAVTAVKTEIASRVASAQRKHAQVRESAWDKIDRFSKAAVELKNGVTATVTAKVDAVERHARASAGVASDAVGVIGGALRKLGDDIAARYESHVSSVAADQAARRAPVTVSKSTEVALASYAVARTPLAEALSKSNVISIGMKAATRIVDVTKMEAGSADATIKRTVESGSADALRVLLSGGANANIVFAHPQTTGAPLHVSLLEMAKTVPAVRLLLEAGANPNAMAGVNMSPPLSSMMVSLASAERAGAAAVMLAHGANPGAGNGAWLSPLAAALTQGEVESVKVMLDAGAKVSERDVVALLYCTEQKMETAYTNVDHQREYRTADQLVKAIFAADRAGVEGALQNERIAALIESMPYMKGIVDNAAPAQLLAPGASAKLG